MVVRTGQFRVVCTPGLVGGQPVRATAGADEFLVLVPENAEAGDSFVFSVTEDDVKAMKNASTASTHIIDTAVLEKKKTLLDIIPQFKAQFESQVLVDPTHKRLLFLCLVLMLSMFWGFIGGTLFATSEYFQHTKGA